MSGALTKKSIAERTGLSLRAVQYYTERGVVIPDINTGEGRGNVRLYGPHDLMEFSIIKVLRDYGIEFSYLKKIMDHISAMMFPDLGEISPYRKHKAMKSEGGPYIAIYRLSNGQISPDEPVMGTLEDVVKYKKKGFSSVLIISIYTICNCAL